MPRRRWRSRTAEEATDLLREERYRLYLDGLEELKPGVAEVLARHQGHLFLNGVKRISAKDAEILAQYGGGLYLNGLEELPDDVVIEWHKRGWLQAAYAQIASASRWDILVRRWLTRNGSSRSSSSK